MLDDSESWCNFVYLKNSGTELYSIHILISWWLNPSSLKEYSDIWFIFVVINRIFKCLVLGSHTHSL